MQKLTDLKKLENLDTSDVSFVGYVYDSRIDENNAMFTLIEEVEKSEMYANCSFYDIDVTTLSDEDLELLPNYVPALMIYNANSKTLAMALGVKTKQEIVEFIGDHV